MTDEKKLPAPPLFWVSEAANDPEYEPPAAPEPEE
jgi:hypothetical protein